MSKQNESNVGKVQRCILSSEISVKLRESIPPDALTSSGRIEIEVSRDGETTWTVLQLTLNRRARFKAWWYGAPWPRENFVRLRCVEGKLLVEFNDSSSKWDPPYFHWRGTFEFNRESWSLEIVDDPATGSRPGWWNA